MFAQLLGQRLHSQRLFAARRGPMLLAGPAPGGALHKLDNIMLGLVLIVAHQLLISIQSLAEKTQIQISACAKVSPAAAAAQMRRQANQLAVGLETVKQHHLGAEWLLLMVLGFIRAVALMVVIVWLVQGTWSLRC